MNKNEAVFTAQTTGVIIDSKNKGLDFPTLITVEYVVNANVYRITESVKYRSEAIKLWVFPVGQKKVPVLPSTAIGTALTVMYDPNAPQNAFIADNKGRVNC